MYENYQNLEFSEVYLNDAGNKIFNSSFFTSEIGFDSEFEKDFSLKYESLFTEYIELNGFKYLPLFHFYDGGNTEYKIEYRKEPYLKIFGPENCTATDIHKFVKTYCCLLSYYSGLVVGFTNAKYVTKDEVAIVIQKTVKHPGNHTDRFWYDYNNNPALFIDQLNFSKAVENYELLREAVSKFLLGQQSTGRIKFILYYNVLEMIRTKHTQGISSIEFNFTLPDGVESAEELIKKQLQELVNYLPEDEKQTFSNKLEGMASTIKLKSMNNQFGDMFKNMGIDCKRDFDFKFKEVIEIRNKIFHGGEFDFNENATLLDILKPSKMPALIDKVFFKFLEVKMLQEEQV